MTPPPPPRRPSVEEWVAAYLATFESCGRGERPVADLLLHYGVPLVLTTDRDVTVLHDAAQVVALAGRQAEALAADGYDHSRILEATTTQLNAMSAWYRATFSRRRRDDTEIGRLTVTYLLSGVGDGRRISALAVHGP